MQLMQMLNGLHNLKPDQEFSKAFAKACKLRKVLFHRLIRTSLPVTAVLLAVSPPCNYANEIINPPPGTGPIAELHIGRLVFQQSATSTWGPGRPWWRIDWPEAEYHFTNGIERHTAVDVAEDSVHLSLDDDAVFDYPFLFAQQVGRWKMSDAEAAKLGEYLERGGFLIVDDFHGPQQWKIFLGVIKRALPDAEIKNIEFDDGSLAIHFDVDQQTQIPGKRHVRGLSSDGEAIVQMPHTPHQWKGIYDTNNRLVVAINFNMDMGDAWEHADDPGYPNRMTSFAYRLGINYVIHAMTH